MKQNNNRIPSVIVLLTLVGLLLGDFHYVVPTNEINSSEPSLVKRAVAQSPPQIYIWAETGGYSRNGVIALASTDEPAVRTSSYNISGNAEVSLYEADEDSLLNYLAHDKEWNQKTRSTDVSKFRLVTTLRHDVSSQGEGSKLLLPLGDSGIWFLRLKLAGTTEDVFIIRSNTGTVVKEGNDEFIFWGQNFKTRRSVNDGTVSIYNLLEGQKELGSGSFNSEGIVRFPLSVESEVALVRVGDDRALVPINLHHLNFSYNYREFQPKSREVKYFIFTDRPIYKPGDKIYFKSILRDDDDVRYTIPSGSARVSVFQEWDERDAIYERTIAISGQGSVYGEVDLPADLDTGYYQLKVSIPDTTRGDFWSSSNVVSFQVEYFRKPEYSIEINALDTEMIAGDKASFEISGNYFFGQPLANQKVKYVIYSADFYEYEYLASQDYLLEDSYRYGYWSSSKYSEGEATLNEKGKAEVTIDTKIPEGRNRSQIFSIEATFDDGSGNPSFARKNMLVFSGEYGIYRDENSIYSSLVGERYTFPLRLVAHNMANVSGIELKASVLRENWVSYQEPNKKYPSYRKEEESLPELKTRTDSGGRGAFSFTPSKSGSYKFTIQGKDGRDNQINKEFWAWISEKGQYYYFGQGDSELQVQTEKNQYAPGDTARLAISSSIPDRDVLLTLERGRVNRFQVVRVSGAVARVDIPIVGTDMPNIYAKVASFSQNAYDQTSVNIPVSPTSKSLKVTIGPDRKIYGPGDTVTLNVQSTDGSGNPLSAEVAVWAVDKALFELVDERPADIFNTFWRERYNDTQESHSLRGISEEGAEGGGCFGADTPVLMADGLTKSIKDIVAGDMVMTRKSENSSELVKAKVIGTHKRTVNGYFIVNGDLKVTLNHRLWMNNAWQEVAHLQIGDTLIDPKGQPVEVSSVEWVNGRFNVYNLEIENYKTYFAGGIWAHNQKGDGGRTVFKDTAYWNPTVRTNASGQAQVRFKLPDNLTTWVVAAIGATIDTKVGQNTEDIIVTKDVIVRPILPNILRSGDEITLSAIVQNFTEFDQNFDIKLSFDSGRVESAETTSSIKSKDLQQFYWKVFPEKESERAKLTFSARSKENQNLSDTITQEIPVWAFGFWENRAETGDSAKTYNIQLSPDSHKEKSKITLAIAPTLLGTLPKAMEYLVEYPYGCVEQTTSRFVPAVIAKLNQDLFAASIGDKNLDDIILTGVNRLDSLQHSDGGWSWWGSGESSPFITAYVVEYLVKAKQAGIKVDDEIVNDAQRFLESASGGREETIAKAYGLTFLNSSQSKTIITDVDGLSPDFLALAVMANIKNGEKNPDRNGLNKLISLAKPQGDGLFWGQGNSQYFGSQDASTAFAIRAIVAGGGDRELAVKGTRYLTRNRKTDYWSNTFATAQIVQALVDLSRTGQELNPNYTYFVNLDGKRLTSGTVTSAKQILKDIVIEPSRIKKDGSTIEVGKERGEGQLYSIFVIKEFRTDKSLPALNHGLEVKREYISDKGQDYSLAVGDTITVRITVSGLGADENYGIIDDELPSGLIPINQSLSNEQYGQSPNWYYDSYDVTDREYSQNGVELSLYRIGAGNRIYTYKARAVSTGTFTVPPVTALLMYAPEVYGRSEAQNITIARESKLLPGRQLPALADKAFGEKPGLILLILLVIMLAIVGIILHKRGQLMPLLNRISQKLRGKKGDENSHNPPNDNQQT